LCLWGYKLDSSAITNTFTAFAGTACPSTANTDLSASPPGPFCYTCTMPSSEPSTSPSSNPSAPVAYDVALNGVASSSSAYSSSYLPAEAINGITSPTVNGDMFISAEELAPWWKVELDAAYKISQVTVYNRINSLRLAGFQVLLKYEGAVVFQYVDDTTYSNDSSRGPDFGVAGLAAGLGFPYENIIELGEIIQADEVIVKLPDTKTGFVELSEVVVMGY